MNNDSAPINLTNHFLIAMPGLADAHFAKSVVYLCEHNERGALGLVINKPSELTLADLFDKVDLRLGRTDLQGQAVFHGGPVQTDRGFVLHEGMSACDVSLTQPTDAKPNDVQTKPNDAEPGGVKTEPGGVKTEPDGVKTEPGYASTLLIPGGLEMTTSRDVLEALSSGVGPSRVFVTLGYAAWSGGQLEAELGDNAWLSVPAQPSLIFDTPVAQRYDQALGLLGIAAWTLLPEAGHA